MACRITRKACKTANETQQWAFDYAGYDQDSGSWGFLVRVWSPGTVFAADVVVRPTYPTGFEYVATAGQTGQTEPRWPTTVAGTVTDGSVTWTAQEISNDSLTTTIDSSAWSADTGINVDNDSLETGNGKQMTSAHISGGAIGEIYDVANVITLADGTVEESVLRVTVE